MTVPKFVVEFILFLSFTNAEAETVSKFKESMDFFFCTAIEIGYSTCLNSFKVSKKLLDIKIFFWSVGIIILSGSKVSYVI